MVLKTTQNPPEALLTPADSNQLKGLAACCVILSHAVHAAQSQGLWQSGIYTLFTQLGGIGVLIFFFLSGYGIYKSYGTRRPGREFLGKRTRNIVVPVICIKIFLYLIMTAFGWKFNLQEIRISFQSEWFVAIILIEYILFYLSWFPGKAEHIQRQIPCDILLNICLIIYLILTHADPKWYNGVLLFPAGMLIAKNEKQLSDMIKRKWGLSLGICTIVLVMCSFFFAIHKEVWWANMFKTAAGIALGLLFCIIFRKIQCQIAILDYIGRRSLYYYVIHVNLIAVWKMDFVAQRWSILAYTVILSELFYRLTARKRKEVK